MNSLYATCIDEQDEKEIVGWVNDYTKDLGADQLPCYLTVTEDPFCELSGCKKYKVVWLGSYEIVERTVYIDGETHEIAHATR